MSDHQPRQANTFLWARGPHRRDVPVGFQSIHTYDWWEAEEAAGNERLRAFRDLTPADVTPALTLELTGTLLQEIARVALLTKVLALENAPRKRGRPPKVKEHTLTVVGADTTETVCFPKTVLTSDEARALGRRLLQAALAAEGDEQIAVDALMGLDAPTAVDEAR